MAKVVSIFHHKKFNLLTAKKSGYDSHKLEGNAALKSPLSLEDRNHLRQLFEVKNGAN